ncbi:MAG: hypothetical protein DRN96_04425 [Thermoproteota archaeon]|nr:MAG: hypothetical protein DRN96_04425 [Candidatus Korarchaeota archaeon]RLG56034.1 MAG: hypothetical protein DRN99_00855 [Candidatus Korarchaeota archaeon]
MELREIVLVVSMNCLYSKALLRYLRAKYSNLLDRVKFIVVDDPSGAEEAKKLGVDFTPTLIVDGRITVVGFEPDKIKDTFELLRRDLEEGD